MEKELFNELLNEKMYYKQLSSGVKCYTIPKKGFTEKQAVIAYNYGSIDSQFQVDNRDYEVPDGIAHFLEHKLFEEEGKSVFDLFSNQGASVNAYTNFTNTAYYFNCIDNFDENFKLLLDFTSNPHFTDENVEKEKGIIAEEIRMYDDYPFWKVYFNMLDGLYFESPVKKNIAGTVESIEKITKEMLYDCYNTFYYPENTVIVCVGDFKPDEIYQTIEDKIQKQPSKEIARIYGTEKNTIKKNYMEEKMSVARPMFNIGFKDNDFKQDIFKKTAASKMLLDYIAGDSSDFFEKMYNGGALDNSFGMEYVSATSYGLSIFSGYTENPKKLQEVLLDEIQTIKKSGIKAERFEKIKRKHLGMNIRNFNSINSIATGQVDMFSKNGTLFDLVDSYKDIQMEDLNERLSEHFTRDNAVLSVVVPK